MAVRPEGPVELDIGARSDLSVQRGRLGADNATPTVTTTLEIGRGYVLNETVTLDLTGNTLGFGACVGVLVRLVEYVFLVANGGIVDIAVAGNGGSESESGSNVLHCERRGEMYDPAYQLGASEEANEYKLGKLKKKRMNAMFRYWMTWRAEINCARLSSLYRSTFYSMSRVKGVYHA